MSERFVLNETSHFGRGSREVLASEITNRGYKKVLFVTDKTLLECGVAAKVTEVLDKEKYNKILGINTVGSKKCNTMMDKVKYIQKMHDGGGVVCSWAYCVSRF